MTEPHDSATTHTSLERSSQTDEYYTEPDGGFTAIERACIELRVPDSGTNWLDALIAKAQRRDAATAMLSAMVGNGCDVDISGDYPGQQRAGAARMLADAILATDGDTAQEGE